MFGQLELFTAPPQDFSGWLSQQLSIPVRIAWTANRSTMVSCLRDRQTQGLQVRLHHMFQRADAPVWRALARYLDGDARATPVIDRFLAAIAPRVAKAARALRPQGRCHDLAAIAERLNHDFFARRCAARITWGRANPRRRSSILLGSYTRAENLIRIHPCLDQSFVPEYYLAWVVYHEMLHEAWGVEGGCNHPPEFRALESLYPDADRAAAWERQHIDRLLQY
jgi:hypothetical protein